MNEKVLSQKELESIDGYFRALNYVSAASLYLKDNPLLKRPLEYSDIKSKLVGHFGSAPGQNFAYVHCNREIIKRNLNMMWISGPGHSGQSAMANAYFEGTYGYYYRDYPQNEEGLKKFMKKFSFPGGTSSHVAPVVPGSIHEGGELGYSLSHAFGAAFDNPDLIVAVMVGDGEAETGPLATSWHGNKFLNPKYDGAVLPILHLNGYKIANPTILSRISEDELKNYFRGCGWIPYIVEGNTKELHQKMAETMDEVIERIQNIQHIAREKNIEERPLWPMIILKTPKGWTGPKKENGKPIEDSFRSHQIPLEIQESNPESIQKLENWLKSYKPEELFNEEGSLKEEYRTFIPDFDHAMSNNKHANGGLLRKDLILPDFKEYGLKLRYPGEVVSEDMRNLGAYLRDVIKLNDKNKNFRIFGPDEALSNRFNHVFEETNRQFEGKILSTDEFLSTEGRVLDSFLSEHMCEGWLEGYLLTGRHGLFHSYESFIRIVDSMVSQHAKWIKTAKEISWREPISSLNLLVTSHCWQQDHNGYTHQDPGMINHVITKKAEIARVYLPCDTNTLLSVANHILKSTNYVNLVVASKHPRPQWLTMNQAVRHCEAGVGIWAFASNDIDNKPDLVLACAGDTPTLEVMAATSILRKFLPNLKVRVVNVVDLMKLQSDHPHGLSDKEYDYIFTKNKPIVFAFHGYPNVIHELTHRRTNQNMHVRGYIEEGTITTPFDMRVQNKMDRYSLILLALKHLPEFDGSRLKKHCQDMLKKHREYIIENGIDMPEVANWKWDI